MTHHTWVPEVIDNLTTHEILATELVEGLPLDKCFELDQESKNKVCIFSSPEP